VDGTGRLFAATDGGQLMAVDLSDGHLLWSARLAGPVYQAPAIRDDEIVIPTTRGVLEVVNAAHGEPVWTFDVANPETKFTSPAIGPDHIVVGTSDAEVIALDRASGKTLWRRMVDDAVVAPPLMSDDVIFVGTMGMQLLALDPETGEIVWQTDVSGRIKSAMAVHNGRLIVLTDRQQVEVYGPADSNQDRMADAGGGRR
jgi:outer membrane protein assembly factor BamB